MRLHDYWLEKRSEESIAPSESSPGFFASLIDRLRGDYSNKNLQARENKISKHMQENQRAWENRPLTTKLYDNFITGAHNLYDRISPSFNAGISAMKNFGRDVPNLGLMGAFNRSFWMPSEAERNKSLNNYAHISREKSMWDRFRSVNRDLKNRVDNLVDQTGHLQKQVDPLLDLSGDRQYDSLLENEANVKANARLKSQLDLEAGRRKTLERERRDFNEELKTIRRIEDERLRGQMLNDLYERMYDSR